MYTLQAMLCSIKIGVFSTILGYETLFRTSLWHMTRYNIAVQRCASTMPIGNRRRDVVFDRFFLAVMNNQATIYILFKVYISSWSFYCRELVSDDFDRSIPDQFQVCIFSISQGKMYQILYWPKGCSYLEVVANIHLKTLIITVNPWI